MATFGLTTIGSGNNTFNTGFAMGQHQTMGSIAGTADSLECYTSTASNVKGIIYNLSGLDATTLVANSGQQTTSVAAAWTVLTLGGEALSASTNYAIGIVNMSTGDANLTIYWDLVTGDRSVGTMPDTPPDPWTTDTLQLTGRIYSYFVNYTENTSAPSGPPAGSLSIMGLGI